MLPGSSSLIFVADPAGGPAAMETFSALVHALYELECAVVVRRVYNVRSAPRLGALLPRVKAVVRGEGEQTHAVHSMVYTELPFSEDIRNYIFPSLPDCSGNVSQQSEAVRRFQPSSEQLDLMDSLIDEMNLQQVP